MSTFEEYQQNVEEENYETNYQENEENNNNPTESSTTQEVGNQVVGEKRPREDEAPAFKRQRVDVSNRKIMIKDLSFDVRREAVYEMFIKYGPIDDLKFPLFPDSGRSKGFAFIIYRDPESAQKSLEANGAVLGDRQITVVMGGERNPFSGSTKEIFVGNLPFEATEQDVKTFFEKYGNVTDVRLPTVGNKKKGFGYITFATIEDVKEALKANGVEFMGRPIRVNEEIQHDRRRPVYPWRPYPPRDPRGFGGFDRGGYYPMGGDRFGRGDRFMGRGGRGGRFDNRFMGRGGRFDNRFDHRYDNRFDNRYDNRMGDRYGDRMGDWKRRM